MNGTYEVEKEDWEGFDTDRKLWMIFNTFNEHRDGYHKHKELCNTRFCNVENKTKYLKTGIVGLVCFLSGAGVIGGKEIFLMLKKMVGL